MSKQFVGAQNLNRVDPIGFTFEPLESRRLLSAGDLVSNFGVNGVATVSDAGATDNSATAIAAFSDGSFIVGGNSFSGPDDVGTLIRYNQNGSLDTTFGGGTGKLRLAIPWMYGVQGIAVNSDNSFLGIGTIASGSTGSRVQKFLANGSLDPAWIGPGTTPGSSPRAIKAIASGQSIYVTASSISRLKADGTVDTTFGTNGLTTFPNEGTSPIQVFSPNAIAIQTDGAIVLVGEMRGLSSTSYIPAVRRYTASGQLDTTFGTGGTVKLTSAATTNPNSSLRDVYVYSSGNILVAGSNGLRPTAARLTSTGAFDSQFPQRTYSTVSGSFRKIASVTGTSIQTAGFDNAAATPTDVGGFLVKTSSTGVADPSFGGGDGIVDRLLPSGWAVASELNLISQSDGRLIMASAGYATPNSPLEQFVTRINTDGSLDPALHQDSNPLYAGVLVERFNATRSITAGVPAVASDGSVVFNGFVRTLITDGPLARLKADGSGIDQAFGTNGEATVDAGAKGEVLYESIVQPDGKIVSVGRASFYDWTTSWNEDFLIARTNPDGTMDTAFGSGRGVTTSDFGAAFQQFTHVALQSDGKILASGVFQAIGASRTAAVVRYLANGQVDTAFGNGGIAKFDLPAGTDEIIVDLAALPNGQVLVGGYLTVDAETSADANCFVARLDSLGKFDAGFGDVGANGVAYVDAVPTAADDEFAVGLDIDLNGNIFIGGSVSTGGTRALVSKFDSAGHRLTSFGVNGTALATLGTSDSIIAFGRAPSGKFLFAGSRGTSSSRDILALRLDSTGAIDSTFGSSGFKAINTGVTNELAAGIHFLAGGSRILLTGSRSLATGNAWAAVMLEGDVTPPPAVSGVFVNSTSWSTSFRNFLATSSAGNAMFGFAIDPSDQLNELPWTNLNQLSIRFNRDVAASVSSLSLIGTNVSSYAVVGFAYDTQTYTGTWTLNTSISSDKLLLKLSGVIDPITGLALDGEWPETASRTFPSGDGVAGGDFVFRLNVLPGDVNRSGGSVLGSDVTLVRNAQNSTPGAAGSLYTIFKDVNGSGSILGSDVTLVSNRQGTSLPAGEPSTAVADVLFNETERLPMGHAILPYAFDRLMRPQSSDEYLRQLEAVTR